MSLLARLPVRAYPAMLRHLWRQWINSRRRPPSAVLSNADLDFFFGGTESATHRLSHSNFRFFAPQRLLAQPSPDEGEALLARRLTLLGREVLLDDPPQWHTDFFGGYTWARDHISKLKLVVEGADVKVPWELSRFQHGAMMARAYAETNDRRYFEEWKRQFENWLEANLPEYGVNWGNAMEAAIRAVNWIAAYEWMRSTFDVVTAERLFKSLIQHGRFIRDHLEEYYPPTNHLLANLCGLVWLGIFLAPANEAKAWLAFALPELRKQLTIQILPDGASYEASTSYHRFVTEMILSTVQLCLLNDVQIDSRIVETAEKMTHVVKAIRKPDGSLPLFGDEDGGHWIGRGECRLLIAATGEALPQMSFFPHAGWYVYRRDQDYLAIRAGDNGQNGWGGHAHNDALSFELSVAGRNILIDPGTYTYTADPDTRNLFRSTAYHNTLQVDGEEISRLPPGELFRLENDVRVKVLRAERDVWEGEHYGYSRLGVVHRRRFERTPNGWRIYDSVIGRDEHLLQWHFLLYAVDDVLVEQNGVYFKYSTTHDMMLLASRTDLKISATPVRISLHYGEITQAHMVKFESTAKLPADVLFSATYV